MNNEKDTLVSDRTTGTSPAGAEGTASSLAPSVGERLRAARVAKQISVGEAAAMLKLSPRQIDALEADDWSHLPATIVRGFVRNYGRYLGVEVGALMLALDSAPSLPEGPELKLPESLPIRLPVEGKADRHDYVRVIAGVFILLLALSTYYFVPAETWKNGVTVAMDYLHRQKQNLTPESGREADLPAPGKVLAPEPVVVPVPAPVAEPTPETAPVAPREAPPREPPPEPAAAPAPTLGFSFSGASWVEVRDRHGNVVFSQLNPAGSRQEVSGGKPPFVLVIGNASQVALQYKGQPVDLSDKRSKDDVARLTLE